MGNVDNEKTGVRDWLASLVLTVAGGLLLVAIAAVFSAVRSLDSVSFEVVELKRRVAILEDFRAAGGRFTENDGIELKDSHDQDIRRLERRIEQVDGELQPHLKRAEGGWLMIDELWRNRSRNGNQVGDAYHQR